MRARSGRAAGFSFASRSRSSSSSRLGAGRSPTSGNSSATASSRSSRSGSPTTSSTASVETGIADSGTSSAALSIRRWEISWRSSKAASSPAWALGSPARRVALTAAATLRAATMSTASPAGRPPGAWTARPRPARWAPSPAPRRARSRARPHRARTVGAPFARSAVLAWRRVSHPGQRIRAAAAGSAARRGTSRVHCSAWDLRMERSAFQKSVRGARNRAIRHA